MTFMRAMEPGLVTRKEWARSYQPPVPRSACGTNRANRCIEPDELYSSDHDGFFGRERCGGESPPPVLTGITIVRDLAAPRNLNRQRLLDASILDGISLR